MTTATAVHTLSDLKALPQWVCFDENKIPYTPATGKEAKANDATTWGTYEQAQKARSRYKGIGFEFCKEQGITGVDLDHCLDEQGNITPWASHVVSELDSYTEYSPSGRGLHIWVIGSLPDNLNVAKADDGDQAIEAYDCKRYFTITGKQLAGTPNTIEHRQEQLTALYEQVQERRKQARRAKQQSKKRTQDKPTSVLAGDTPYGLKALESECHELASTAEGGRNPQLFKSAAAMGELVTGHESIRLTRSTVERELTDAARRSGLGEQEIAKTLRGGIDKGMLSPRSAPLAPAPQVMSNGHGEGNGVVHTAQTTPGRSFNRTDMGNAERLVAWHGDDLRYCHERVSWLVWNGTHWQEDKNGQAERIAKKAVRHIYAEASTILNDADRKATAAHAMRSESKKAIRDMLTLAQSEEGIPVSLDMFDYDPWLLNCANGTLDLRTAQLHRHNRADLITRCIPTAYKHDAVCPLWESFLDTIFSGNTDLIRFMQRALGYALTGLTSEQVFFLLWGKGQNGKSTMLETVQKLLGDYAQSAPFESFLAKKQGGIPNDIARMNGKRMIIAKESDKGKRFSEAMVKQITGEDTLTARFLHKEFFDFMPQFKLFLAANDKPTIKGTDTGIWRRVRLIPFNVTISDEQKDTDLSRKLAMEAEGILAWLVAGCIDWQINGLVLPDEVKKATGKYRSDMDIVGTFISEECEKGDPDPKNGYKVGVKILADAFETWCKSEGEYPDAKRLHSALSDMGLQRDRSTGGITVWRGIKLKEVKSEE